MLWKLYEDSFTGLGVLIFVAGVVMGLITVRTLSIRVLLGFPEIQASQYPSKLVMKGIYQYLRHPRYLEFILEVLGIAILSGRVWNFILLVYIVPAVWLLSVVEERELVQRFGQSYIEYRKRVGRFFPKI
ncbi:MAG: isoprenylcysteine carboxylmethyltransferase family protein [Deltaproteobacteria bacterium]|nr:isoprenylcysteine carboxylmethyltransferase family protein [Deltaproteobacteria bacterium]